MVEPEAVQRARVQLGRQLAAYRKAIGYGQEQLASLVFVSRSTIANVETGRQRVPRAFWEQCDVVLATGGLLTAGYDELRRLDRQLGVEAAAHLSIRGQSQKMPHPSSDDVATANEALPLTNLVMALTAHQLSGVQRPAPTNHPLFERGSVRASAELLLKSFLKLDDEQGGDALYLPLSHFVAEMSQAADERPDGNLGVFGQLSQMTGWLALDANRHSAARRYLTTAVYAAHEADEPSLAASALAYMSLQDTYRGRITSALSLARTALRLATAVLRRSR
jgi:transcriptional regulator with XRE-family HTH domain